MGGSQSSQAASAQRPTIFNQSELHYLTATLIVGKHVDLKKLDALFPLVVSPRFIALLSAVIHKTEGAIPLQKYTDPQIILSALSSLCQSNSRNIIDLLADAFLPDAVLPFDAPQAHTGLYHILTTLHLARAFQSSPTAPIFQRPTEPLGLLSAETLHAGVASLPESAFSSPLHFRSTQRSFAAHIKNSGSSTTTVRDHFRSWAASHMPSPHVSLCLLMRELLLRACPLRSPHRPLTVAEEDGLSALTEASAGWRGNVVIDVPKIMTEETLTLMSSLSPVLSEHRPHRLFANWSNGTSFVLLAKQLVAYPSPTLVAVRTKKGQILGAISCSAWKEGGHLLFGDLGDASLLFSLRPQLALYRPTGRATKTQYLNPKHKYSELGLGWAENTSSFRLFINATLMKGRCLVSDQAFEQGPLLWALEGPRPQDEVMQAGQFYSPARAAGFESLSGSNGQYEEEFDIAGLEVWGFGGPEALKRQQQALAREDQLRTERRMVDKARMAGNSFDREMLLGGTFGAGGREAAEQERKREEDK